MANKPITVVNEPVEAGKLRRPLHNNTGRPLHFTYRGKDEILPPNPGIHYTDAKYRFALGLTPVQQPADRKVTRLEQEITFLKKELAKARETIAELTTRVDATERVSVDRSKKIWSEKELMTMTHDQLAMVVSDMGIEAAGNKKVLVEAILNHMAETPEA